MYLRLCGMYGIFWIHWCVANWKHSYKKLLKMSEPSSPLWRSPWLPPKRLRYRHVIDNTSLLLLQLFMRDEPGSSSGHWAITDCHPNDVACGGGAHQLLISPDTECDGHCVHQLPNSGWTFCNGELTANGICTRYGYDDTVKWTCLWI